MGGSRLPRTPAGDIPNHPFMNAKNIQKQTIFGVRDLIKFFWCRIKKLINAWLPMLPLLPPALSPQIFYESLLFFNVFRWFSTIISYSKWVLKESQLFPMIFNIFQWFSAISNYFQCKSMISIDLQWSSMIFNDYHLFSKISIDMHWFPMLKKAKSFNGFIEFLITRMTFNYFQ